MALAWAFLLAATSSFAPQATARSHAPLRLYVLDCGMIHTEHSEGYGVSPAEAGVTDMSVACYLIRHGSEYLLFDAGLGDDRQGRSDQVLDMTLEVHKSLRAQLFQLGIKPARVGQVAVSHFHYDHVGNLPLFPDARLLVQRPEAQRMQTSPYPFTPPAAVERLNHGDVHLLDREFDVFGDNSVVLVRTPGHSPGHQSLLVRLRRTGTVLLTGDLYHYAAERALHRIPDREKSTGTAESRAHIEAIVAGEGGQVWIEHDLSRFARQKKSPRFYD